MLDYVYRSVQLNYGSSNEHLKSNLLRPILYRDPVSSKKT